jgi:rod shape determining protein RodA
LLILFLAGFVADRSRRVGEWRVTWSVVGLAAVPIVLVFEQPDFGSALIYGCAAAAVLLFGGLPWKQLGVLAALVALVALSMLWFLPAAGVEVLDQYQKDRLIGFVHPDVDPTGTTYNITQSITAVGSGGYDGRGVAGATQTNLDFLPEHNTDFIFSSLAEQRGFVGAALLLVLYALVVWRGVRIVAIAPTLFTAVVAAAITFGFVFQIFVNIGMTIGIAPITGIPLPFVSYGGTSMIVSLMMVGLLAAIHVRGRLAGQR